MKPSVAGFVPHTAVMQKALGKTIGRTSSFFGATLVLRAEARPYAPLVYGLFAGVVWVTASLVGDPHWTITLTAGVVLLGLLAPVCAVDARFGIIPDSLVIALAATGCLDALASALRGGADPVGRLVGAAIAFAAAWLFRAAYRRLRGFDGLGLGDVKLFGAGVLWTGLDATPAIVLVAVTSALATVGLLRGQGVRMANTDAIAFGPHLALGIWFGWIAGDTGLADRLLS